MLVIAVLLTSGLMAASEMPELLTLTDNVSNDYELACQCLPGCSTQQIVRSATTPSHWLVAANSQPGIPAFFSSTTCFEEKNSPSLSILGVQRK
jgi:hypothetical protein